MPTKASGKLLWSNDPKDLGTTPFLVIDTKVPQLLEKVPQLFGTDLDSDVYRSTLPSRIVVIPTEPASSHSSNTQVTEPGAAAGSGSSGERNNLFPPILRVSSGSLAIPKCGASEKDQNKFILDLYDLWIQKLIERRQKQRIGISIYFEDPTKAEVWGNIFNSNTPSWASEVKFLRERPKNYSSDLSDVNIWRHILYKEIQETLKQKSTLYYEFTTYHNPFFSYLYSIDKSSFHAEYVLRQIAEAALLRILVIDDRVASNIWNRQNRNTKIAELKYMGVYIARTIVVNGLSGSPIVLAGEEKDAAPGWVELTFDGNGEVQSMEIVQGNGQKEPLQPDLLFIHQTIFENRIAPSLSRVEEKNQWVNNWKKTIPYVIFHSGRGKQTEKLPQNAAFLEYSVLQEHLLQEPSKFFLTQIAMSARR